MDLWSVIENLGFSFPSFHSCGSSPQNKYLLLLICSNCSRKGLYLARDASVCLSSVCILECCCKIMHGSKFQHKLADHDIVLYRRETILRKFKESA